MILTYILLQSTAHCYPDLPRVHWTDNVAVHDRRKLKPLYCIIKNLSHLFAIALYVALHSGFGADGFLMDPRHLITVQRLVYGGQALNRASVYLLLLGRPT